MKRNIFLTIVIILVVTGAISYLVIWYRNKKNSVAGSQSNQNNQSGTSVNQSNSSAINTGSLKPTDTASIWAGSSASGSVNTNYDTWIAKIGHTSFPLGNGSKGVEVVKVQEELNKLIIKNSNLGFQLLVVDGIWGNKTQTAFKTFFPSYSGVDVYMFITVFDKNGEILK